ncbi:hypothetical protein LFL97_32275 [Burkholderia sp. JSH-S8]|nr:hypothetical protein LFL97_32275 [Burkholderia sp. JSH-S8]
MNISFLEGWIIFKIHDDAITIPIEIIAANPISLYIALTSLQVHTESIPTRSQQTGHETNALTIKFSMNRSVLLIITPSMPTPVGENSA